MKIQFEGEDKTFVDLAKIFIPVLIMYAAGAIGIDPCSIFHTRDTTAHAKTVPSSKDTLITPTR